MSSGNDGPKGSLSGRQKAADIDDAVMNADRGPPAWKRAGMTRDEWQAGQAQRQAELDVERLRKNQSHPGNR